MSSKQTQLRVLNSRMTQSLPHCWRKEDVAGMFIRYIFSLWYVVHWYIADAAMYQCRYLTRPAVLKVGTLYMAMYQLSWGNVRRARNLWKGTQESLEHGRS